MAKAADELVESRYLASYEFFKSGKYNRICFCRAEPFEPIQLPLVQNFDLNCDISVDSDTLAELWATVVGHFPDDRFPKRLTGTRLILIEDGTATIAAGDFRDWIENRLSDKILKALQRELDNITAVHFVE